jgi:hypothetical protein
MEDLTDRIAALKSQIAELEAAMAARAAADEHSEEPEPEPKPVTVLPAVMAQHQPEPAEPPESGHRVGTHAGLGAAVGN